MHGPDDILLTMLTLCGVAAHGTETSSGPLVLLFNNIVRDLCRRQFVSVFTDTSQNSIRNFHDFYFYIKDDKKLFKKTVLIYKLPIIKKSQTFKRIVGAKMLLFATSIFLLHSSTGSDFDR